MQSIREIVEEMSSRCGDDVVGQVMREWLEKQPKSKPIEFKANQNLSKDPK